MNEPLVFGSVFRRGGATDLLAGGSLRDVQSNEAFGSRMRSSENPVLLLLND